VSPEADDVGALLFLGYLLLETLYFLSQSEGHPISARLQLRPKAEMGYFVNPTCEANSYKMANAGSSRKYTEGNRSSIHS
jgi:hypothetical protein